MVDHPAPPSNDTCTGSVPLITFDATGHATVPDPRIPAGAIDEAMNDGTGAACGTLATGPDVVYYFSLAQDQQVVVQLVPAATYAPTIYLRKDFCSSAAPTDEVGCATTTTGGTTVSIIKNVLSQGTYYLWVDSGGGTSGKNWGTYQINLTMAAPLYPPPNDTCTNPTPLSLGQTVPGDTTAAAADYFGSTTVTWSAACTSSTWKPKGHDVVYSFTPAVDGTYVVSLAPAGWDALLWYSTSVCGDASACGGIHDVTGTTSETLSISALGGTTYYVYVSVFTATVSPSYCGAFTIVIN